MCGVGGGVCVAGVHSGVVNNTGLPNPRSWVHFPVLPEERELVVFSRYPMDFSAEI